MATFFASPGVYPTVVDQSPFVAGVPTSIGALVGASNRGKVGVKLVTTEGEFVQEYGIPVPGNHFHYSAIFFLRNGNQLYCRRVANGALYGGAAIAQSGGTNYSFVSGFSTPVFSANSNYPSAAFYIFAKDPGTWNNSISVDLVLVNAATYEFKIVVYDLDAEGNRVVVPGETWTVSRNQQLDGYGVQEFMETKINGFSKYIVVANNPNVPSTVLPQFGTDIEFAGGDNGTAVIQDVTGNGLVAAAWNDFANPEAITVQILINGGWTDPTVQQAMKNVCVARQDACAIQDPAASSLTSASGIVTWNSTTRQIDSSYCALYAPWVMVVDNYNHMNVVTVPSGLVAGKWAFGDSIGNVWEAPAFERVGSLDIVGTCDANGTAMVFSKADRDLLYPAKINPLQTFPGRGTQIFGQVTSQVADSDLSSINIRREVNAILTALVAYYRGFLGKLNNEQTRFLAQAGGSEFCGLLAAAGAFNNEQDAGFKVVCDETNNTPAVISRKEMPVDVYIKPVHVTEFIPLSIVITPLGVSFSAVGA